MGKKNKEHTPVVNLNSVTNRDIIQRMNFLYQASAYLNSISPARGPQPSESRIKSLPAQDDTGSSQAQPSAGKQKRLEKLRMRHPTTAHELARSYVKSMRSIGQKTTVKMDPAVKRTLCRKCDVVLIPGATATVRVKTSSSHGHIMCYTCMSCKTTRRIPAPPILDPSGPSEIAASEAPLAVQMRPDYLAPPSEMPMDTTPDAVMGDATPAAQVVRPKSSSRKRKKSPLSRIPPLFERKVGHVVFRGNAQLDDEMVGWGYSV
ncbi:Rpr2-domain-containing protein [Obba rivulosa]|uniref:Rpr2-domain-containing protein n=1 Tax=Obba rivulosa TaxID=1052685 RepID=A0A8E2DQ66_9APHY|nr:Rpr2-domain-containing protein [Obba rivulosa]